MIGMSMEIESKAQPVIHVLKRFNVMTSARGKTVKEISPFTKQYGPYSAALAVILQRSIAKHAEKWGCKRSSGRNLTLRERIVVHAMQGALHKKASAPERARLRHT